MKPPVKKVVVKPSTEIQEEPKLGIVSEFFRLKKNLDEAIGKYNIYLLSLQKSAGINENGEFTIGKARSVTMNAMNTLDSTPEKIDVLGINPSLTGNEGLESFLITKEEQEALDVRKELREATYEFYLFLENITFNETTQSLTLANEGEESILKILTDFQYPFRKEFMNEILRPQKIKIFTDDEIKSLKAPKESLILTDEQLVQKLRDRGCIVTCKKTIDL